MLHRVKLVARATPQTIGESEISVLHGHTSEVTHCEWSPDGMLLASVSSEDATTRIWEFDPLTLRSKIRRIQILNHPHVEVNLEKVKALQWKDDGTLLATCSDDGKARIWSRDGELKRTFGSTREFATTCGLKWSSESNPSILMWKDSETALWNVFGAACHLDYNFHKGPVLDADWGSRDMFATSSADKMIYVGCISQKYPIESFGGHTGAVNSVRWDPSGRFLASGSDDCTVKIWTIWEEDAGMRQDLGSHDREVFAVRWSPTPDKPLRLASASRDSVVKIWDLEKEQPLHSLSHKGLTCIAFSPDGKYLASGSQDNGVHVWSMKDGSIVRSYPATGKCDGVCWSPQRKLAVGLSDGSVRVLDFSRLP